MAGVCDVLKTAEYNQSSAARPEQETSHDGKVLNIVVLMTTARTLRSRVRRNSHARFCSGGGGSDVPAYHK